MSIAVFGQAQDSIPHFTELSKQVFQCLSNRNYDCLEDRMVSLKEFVQLMEPALKDIAAKRDSSIEIDTNAIVLYEPEYRAELKNNIDTLYALAERLKINWNKAAFISMSDSTVDHYMLSEYGVATAQCTIKFSDGDRVYGIDYGLRFMNKKWVIEELHRYIVVYNKDGSDAGVMRENGYDTDMDGYSHTKK
jgi:hypothetical protein